MRITASDAAAATGGRLVGQRATFNGASIDSRTIRAGQLFVPIVAERDGHAFIDAALEAGAAGYLSARPSRGATAIEVANTLTALADLGRLARTRLPESVVGITGSVGKTTTKDMLVSILSRSRHISASERSFNNELGVPLTLLNADPDTECVIVEMGARGVGHIRELCAIARPTIGVVTTIALAHAELFGDIDAIAVAKGELVEALPEAGTAVLNADDPLVVSMASRTSAEVLTFGVGGDVVPVQITLGDDLRATIRFETPFGEFETTLGARGSHQVVNAGAAAAAALALGATIDDVAAGLGDDASSSWRMDLVETPTGALVLNDAYNANRTSAEAGLQALAHLNRPRKTAVLGLMAELGETAPSEHAAVAALADQLSVRVVAYGTDLYGTPPVGDLDEAAAALGTLDERDAVLIKGSRVNQLERLVDRLLAAGR